LPEGGRKSANGDGDDEGGCLEDGRKNDPGKSAVDG
jgi:hypothetical protein